MKYIMELENVMICLNCERVFSVFDYGYKCPACAKGPVHHLSTWIRPLLNDQRRKRLVNDSQP